MVELMMAIAVFAIGVSGIIAMQKVTLASNIHAKNLAIATHVGQAWAEMLDSDSAAWNHPSQLNGATDLDADTVWLKQITTNEGKWIRPAHNAGLKFGPGFDALGNPTSVIGDAAFCTHIRLTWLKNQTDIPVGNGLIRAEVRVFWHRDVQGGGVDDNPLCATGTDPLKIADADGAKRHHFVYHTTAIRQNTAVR